MTDIESKGVVQDTEFRITIFITVEDSTVFARLLGYYFLNLFILQSGC
jgi:hypothetical protein